MREYYAGQRALKKIISHNEGNQIIKKIIENALNLRVPIEFNQISNLLELDGIDINTTGINGLTLLHISIKQQNLVITKLLLNKGANCNAQDNFGATPIHYVSYFGCSTNFVETLSDHGCNLSWPDSLGKTPLHY